MFIYICIINLKFKLAILLISFKDFLLSEGRRSINISPILWIQSASNNKMKVQFSTDWWHL